MNETPDQIAAIRDFNRFYTRISGLLGEGMHSSAHPLPEARVIYEIGERGSTTASAISDELNMDRSQLSRLLWRLSDQGLVTTAPAPDDRRSNTLALTRQGDSAHRHLSDQSNAAASKLLAPLHVLSRIDLVKAMRRIRTLLAGPQQPNQLILRRPWIGDIGWIIHRQGVLYHLEQGWNSEFETLITRIYAEFDAAPAAGKSLWIAEVNGEVAGSVFILPSAADASMGQLRMLYVEPAFRGLGIGRKLVAEAVRFSAEAGYGAVMLWTQDCLTSARAIYQAAGFVLTSEERHHAFGVDLNGQYWMLQLPRP